MTSIAETSDIISSGLMPSPRQILPGYDSGVLIMAIGAFLLATIGLMGARRLWHSFFRGLTHSGPAASAAATAEATTGERWSVTAALIQTFMCEGLLLFSYAVTSHSYPIAPPSYLEVALVCSGICALLYCVQWTGYAAVAYAFAPRPASDTKAWLRAFAATQSMLGLWLLLPAIGSLFYPAAVSWLFQLSVALYAAARILFIIKGFRIFYTDTFSFFYFFLYLCTLELLPLLAAATLVMRSINYVIT